MIEVQQTKKRCRAVLAGTLAMCSLLAANLQAGTIPAGAVTLNIGQSVKLDQLTLGNIPGVVVGDKLFKEFIYSWGNNMPSPDNVNVTAIQVQGNYGIRFQGTFIDLPGDTIGSDASVSFSVHVVGDNNLNRISDAHLAGAVFLDPDTPGSFGSIDESFLGNIPSIPDTLHVFRSTLGAGGSKFEDSAVFENTYEWINVQKDIFALAAEAANQPVRMTFFDQTFSQVEIPEPTSASMMLMLGSLAMIGISRRSW